MRPVRAATDSAYPSGRYAQAARGHTRFDHRAEALTGRHLHADTGVSVTRIPPVVPYIRLDSGGLLLAKSARLSAALHGQFTFDYGETLDECWMAVFADDPRPDKRE